jgi:hypothetical protein
VSTREAILKVLATVIWTVCVYGLLGGAFVYRETLPSGLYNRYTLTMYKTLPPPPKGPRYCEFLTVSDYSLARPCDWKPPFVWWLQHRAY